VLHTQVIQVLIHHLILHISSQCLLLNITSDRSIHLNSSSSRTGKIITEEATMEEVEDIKIGIGIEMKAPLAQEVAETTTTSTRLEEAIDHHITIMTTKEGINIKSIILSNLKAKGNKTKSAQLSSLSRPLATILSNHTQQVTTPVIELRIH
jgi:hypothetical protein